MTPAETTEPTAPPDSARAKAMAIRAGRAQAAAGPVRVHSDAAEAAAKRAECRPPAQLDAGREHRARKDA